MYISRLSENLENALFVSYICRRNFKMNGMNLKKVVRDMLRYWWERLTVRTGKTVGKRGGTETAKRSIAEPAVGKMERDLACFLQSRYEFRHNMLTDVTELHRLEEQERTFVPVTPRHLNAICLEAHAEGIACWDRDVARIVHSVRTPDYHPFLHYFDGLPDWDGRDRLEELARRVSHSPLWVNGFRRWMLALAAQWMGLDRMYANSVAPVLVSETQGMGKSTFCRALMPPVLQSYYTDSIDLASPLSVENKLVEMGLINLDEFDRISARKQPLLKNIMQLSDLHLRRAYRRHAGRLPRVASFIGTSNSRELLTDPSGSRRFLCVSVERPIDSSGICHTQVYAQLKALLRAGERYWFTSEEEEAIQRNNAAFYRVCPVEEAFRLYFRAALPGEECRLYALPEVVQMVRARCHGAMAGVNMQSFSRALQAAGVERCHTRVGNRYRIVEIHAD